jgi:ribulose-phosphate 3-epimerase
MKIYPSVMGKSQKEINDLFIKFNGIINNIHLDVADGKFVPNTSLWFNFKLSSKFTYAAHLMIKNPEKWIEKKGGKVEMIIFHLEAVKDVYKVIELIRKKNKKIGIALKPETSVNKIKKYLPLVDFVLILTVHPGFYGAKYLKSPLKKIMQIKKLNSKIQVIVDGGMNPNTIKDAKKSGADIVISGSFIARSDNVNKAMRELKKMV